MMRPEDLEKDFAMQKAGWVPRTGQGFPQIKVARGWEPGSGSPDFSVGVGADGDINPFMSPDEERRRLQAKYGWDPARRLGELGQQWGQNPVMGLISTVGLPFEALGTGVKYAGSVLQGLEQGAGEALAGRPLEGEARNVDQGPFGVKTLPRVQNPFDPAEAGGRYDAIMNPVAQLGVDLGAGARGLGPVSKAAGWAASRAAGPLGAAAQAIPGVSDIANAVGPVIQGTRMPLVNNAMTGFLGDVGKVMTSTPVQRGIGAGLPLAAGASTLAQQDPNEDTGQKILNTGLATVAGLGTGQLLTAGLRSVGNGFTRFSQSFEGTAIAPQGQHAYDPIEEKAWKVQGQAERAGAGGVYDAAHAPLYPGGYAGLVWDFVRQEASDRFAIPQSYTNMVRKENGGTLPVSSDPVEQLKILQGVNEKVKVLVQNVGPVLEQNGVTSKALGVFDDTSQMSDFDKMRFAWMQFQRLTTVGGTSRQRTGPAIDNMKDAQQLLESTANRVNKYYGNSEALQHDPVTNHPILTGAAEKWINAANQITVVGNVALKEAHDAGLISDAQFLSSKQQLVYGALRVTEESKDPIGIQGVSMQHMGLAASQDFGYAHGTVKASTLNMRDDLQHMARLLTLAQQNRVGQAFEGLRQRSPDFADRVMLNKWNGKDINVNTPVPAGFTSIPVYTNVDAAGQPLEKAIMQRYFVPKALGDSLMDMTKGQADLATNWMAKMVQPFHMGITSLSLPFLMHNPPRDVQTAMQNYSGPTTGAWYEKVLGNTGPLWRNLVGAGYEALTGSTGMDLDSWFQRNQNHPLVQSLGKRIHDSLNNFLNPNGLELDNWRWMGGGSERLVAQYSGPQDVARAAGLPGAARGGFMGAMDKVPGGILVTGVPDLIMAAATVGETATRLAVFKAAKQQLKGTPGLSNFDASQMAASQSRSALVDFSKGGNTMRLASVWLPLLNARTQGTLASWEAAKDDPQGFMMKAISMAAIPTVMTYANNRLLHSDLYDKISQDEKDKNHVIIFGSYTNDRGEELPLRLKIPKNEVSAMVSTPLEHFLDTKFHVENHQVPLVGDQRTERSAGDMMMSRLANLLPINLNSNSSLDPGSLMMSTISMNPIVGTVAQMWANRDQWQGQPIIPDDKMMLPPQYRFDERTPELSKAVSKLLHAAGAPEDLQATLAPARTAFMVRGFGGTAGQTFLGAGDGLVAALNKGAEAAGYPKIEFNPKTLQDLGAPLGAAPEFWQPQIDALERQDTRPWYTKAPLLSAIMGTSGGAQSAVSKVEQSLPPKDQEVWRQTREVMSQYQEASQKIQHDTVGMYEASMRGELTHAQVLAKRSVFGGMAKGAVEGLNAKYPLALISAQDRQAFIDKLPGVPVNQALASARSDLPSGLDVDTLVQRYSNPDTDPALAGLGPLARQQAKNLELQQLSNQFKVPVSVLRDYIATSVAGRELPALGIPDLALEKIINDYRTPPDKGGKTVDLSDISGENLGILRRQVIHDAAVAQGVPEDQLLLRVQARLVSPDEQHPVEQSMERAFSISAEARDPQKFPLYVDRSGNGLGTPDEWRYWDSILEGAKGDKRALNSPLIRDLQTAKDGAHVRQLSFLFSQPDYQDYARWFGIGRNMTPTDWEGFMSGQYQKYKDNPTPQEALHRDALIQLWQAMPDRTPEKREMTRTVKQYERLASKNWRAAMMLDGARWEEANYGQSA